MAQKPEWRRAGTLWGGLDRNTDSLHWIHEKEEQISIAKQMIGEIKENLKKKIQKITPILLGVFGLHSKISVRL